MKKQRKKFKKSLKKIPKDGLSKKVELMRQTKKFHKNVHQRFKDRFTQLSDIHSPRLKIVSVNGGLLENSIDQR